MKRALWAALLCAAGSVQAAAPAKPVKPFVFPGLLVDVTTRDGWKLKAKYNPPQEGRMSFLLLSLMLRGLRSLDTLYFR